ncbi:MAG: SufE family protein [Bacteroidales bacterium]|jgi:cysteine desulfuration protein SufE|nr:SufE family protein [Bacteroidales bacterium]
MIEIDQIRSIGEIEGEIVSEFSLFDEWLDKYEYLIGLGKELESINESDKTDDNLIRGCQSRVWLVCRNDGGRLWFGADSDAVITKGIISLLLKVYNGQKYDDIIASDFSFIEKIGLRENLSPTRANGLLSMIKQIKAYALAYKEKEAQQ